MVHLEKKMSGKKCFVHLYLINQITYAPFIHSGKPASFRINKNHGAVFTLIEATGFCDQDLLIQAQGRNPGLSLKLQILVPFSKTLVSRAKQQVVSILQGSVQWEAIPEFPGKTPYWDVDMDLQYRFTRGYFLIEGSPVVPAATTVRKMDGQLFGEMPYQCFNAIG